MKTLLKKRHLPTAVVMLLFLFLTLSITLLCIFVQPNAFRDMLSRLFSQPLLLVLNMLPVALVLLAFSFLLRNVCWSGAVTALLFCGTSIASRIKIETRYEAVYPRDFLLLREVGSAMRHYDINYPVFPIILVLCIFALLLMLGFVFKHKTGKIQPRTILLRLLGTVGSLLTLVILTLTVYSSNDLYFSFDTSNYYNHITFYNEYGFPYSFFHNFTSYTVDKPDGYDREEAEAWDTAPTTSGTGKNVHVIIVMNEAFFSMTDLPVFSYSAEEDPLTNFHALQRDDHAISGYIVVADIGGGTSNTEFDVLTGMQSDALSDTTTIAFGAVARNLDSLFRVYQEDGYVTSFIHPSVGWFYNRENTYEKLGCEIQIYDEDMENVETKGSWVTDAYLASLIEDTFAQTTAQGDMMFSYITTFQNHMSYTQDKYGDGYVFKELSLSGQLSPETEAMVEVYVDGLRDADAMLGELVSYFSAKEEPVVLAFFGDHLPSLGSGSSAYEELGISLNSDSTDPSTFYQAYSTPYLIWANDSGARTLDWENTVSTLDLPASDHISACYLGAMLLEITGRGEDSAWFSFLNSLRRELPVVRNKTYLNSAGVISTSLSEQQAQLIDQWRKWSYYKLCQKEIS